MAIGSNWPIIKIKSVKQNYIMRSFEVIGSLDTAAESISSSYKISPDKLQKKSLKAKKNNK